MKKQLFLFLFVLTYWTTEAQIPAMGTGTFSPLAATATANVPSGSGYQTQVGHSSSAVVGSDNSSNVAVIAVPVITSHPTGATIAGGQDASFRVVATGSGLTYQWQVSHDAGKNFTHITNGGIYSGATSSTLTLAKVPISMNGYHYRVIVSDGANTTSNEAKLSVNIPALDNSMDWQVVGTLEVGNNTSDRSFVLDANNTPFIAYRQRRNLNVSNMIVKKFNGSGWEDVGTSWPTATPHGAEYISIVIAPDGTPYVAYTDYTIQGKATVKKLDGNTWVDVGTTGPSSGDAAWINIAFDANGTLYIAYSDDNTRATVKKFNGTTWENVGSSTPSVSANVIDLVIAANGVPYISSADNSRDYKATVKKLEGNNWVNVGDPGFSGGFPYDMKLALDANNTPFVFYADDADMKATVKRFDGSNWVDVGTPRFSAGLTSGTSLAIDASGVPFVAYNDYYQDNTKTYIRRFNGVNWEVVGSEASQESMGSPKLVFDADGVPFVASGYFSSVTLMKYGRGPTGIAESEREKNLSLYPNPTSETLQVIIPLPKKTAIELRMFDAKGKQVLRKSYLEVSGEFRQTLDLKDKAVGVYLLQLVTNDGIITKRVVKER